MPDNLSGVEKILKATNDQLPGQLFVLAGPSGVGKYTITQMLLETFPAMHRVTTFTTRPQRTDEVEGDQYHFITLEEFRRKSEAGQLLEPAGQDVYGEGHLYSMPADVMHTPAGKHLILAEVDIHGTALLKQKFPDCVAIFVTAPPDVLIDRIKRRSDANMDAGSLAKRMATAYEQFQAAQNFDYIVFNDRDSLEHTVAAIAAIVTAERRRVRPGVDLEAMIPAEELEEQP